MNARAFTSIALVAALALACSRTHAPASPSEVAAQNLGAGSILAQAPILDRMQMAPTTVKHGGTRRLEYHYEIAGVTQTLVYEERVTADGNGRFALDPLGVRAPSMTTAQREVFDLVQKNREGFFFRYRDFGVRKRELMFENYRIVDLRTNPVVAGRECVEFEFERLTGAQSRYHVAVDRETALVLRSTELDLTGRVLANAEFVEFTLDPVVSDAVAWFVPTHQGLPLDPISLSAGGFRFPPMEPRLLPTGYQHLYSEVVRNEQDAWIRRIYSDGVEHLFLLQKGVRQASEQPTADQTDTRTTLGSAATDLPPAAPGPYKIRVCAAGPWTLAEFVRDDEQVFVVGKSEDDVLRLLKSCL